MTRGKKVKSRREREIWNLFLQFREEKEKSVFPFPTFEKRKRNLNSISTLSRGEREIWISFPQFREEKEKSEFYFHTFERRKRNLNFISPVLRREREIWILFPHFREEKEKSEFHFPTFERRKRNLTNIINFREKKGKFQKCVLTKKGWSLFTSGHLDALIFGEQKTVFRTNFIQSLPRTTICNF